MAALECLMQTKKLKTGLWTQYCSKSQNPEDFYYNEVVDALSFRIVSRLEETIVHYIDEHVGLLYRPSDLEIVGIRIEGFKKGFLPKYADLQKEWRLSTNCSDLNDFGDMLITVEKQESEVTKKITDVTSELARKEGFNLPLWTTGKPHRREKVLA